MHGRNTFSSKKAGYASLVSINEVLFWYDLTVAFKYWSLELLQPI